MKTKMAKTAFTMAEILVVIAIIAVLLGVLLPALNQVKKVAKEAKQKAQITSIEIGIELYKNDFGSYPPSHGDPCGNNCVGVTSDYSYCGAQTLVEAMFGLDFLGVHPNTAYRADRLDKNDKDTIYPSSPDSNNLGARKGPYLDRTNIDVFRPRNIFNGDTCNDNLEPNMYTICDVFTSVSRTVGAKRYRVGTPVLYFKANTAATDINSTPAGMPLSIYNFEENHLLVDQGRVVDGENHDGFIEEPGDAAKCGPFYIYIRDPLASTPSLKRPVRPDTYLLISAGYDGLYGTPDDICNFKPNIE